MTLLPTVRAALGAASPLVRGAAVWALTRLAEERAGGRAEAGVTGEREVSVAMEWEAAVIGSKHVFR